MDCPDRFSCGAFIAGSGFGMAGGGTVWGLPLVTLNRYPAWQEAGAGSASGGGISNNGGDSQSVSMSIAPNGTPYIGWNDDSSGDDEIYLRTWNGSSWTEVGAGSANGGGISNNTGNSWTPSISIALDGTPYVGWVDDTSGNFEIYVRRYIE
jgi:hypothetical protein